LFLIDANDLCSLPSALAWDKKRRTRAAPPAPGNNGNVGAAALAAVETPLPLCPELTCFCACRGVGRRDKSGMTEKRYPTTRLPKNVGF